MHFVRYVDDLGIIWLLGKHKSQIPTMALATPVFSLPPSEAIVCPLISTLYRRKTSSILEERGFRFSVRSMSNFDAAGITVETDVDSSIRCFELFRELTRSDSLLPDSILDEDRREAVECARRESFDADSLSHFAESDHRYCFGTNDRINAIEDVEIGQILNKFSKLRRIVSYVGRRVPVISGTEEENKDSAQASTNKYALISGSQSKNFHTARDDLVRLLFISPGVSLTDSRKAALHIAWAILRSREGPIYKRLRNLGAFVYSLGAYSREYVDMGYGCMTTQCRIDHVDEVKCAYFEALRQLARCEVSKGSFHAAKRLLELAHLRTLCNPVAVTQMALNYELSGSSIVDYRHMLSRATIESVADVCNSVLRPELQSVSVVSPGQLVGGY